jgi:hypothetical protein
MTGFNYPMKTIVQPSSSFLSLLAKDKKTYGTAYKEVVFPEKTPRRSKVNKVMAKSLSLKRSHYSYDGLTSAQIDAICVRVRRIMLGAFAAGMVASSMCCWLVNANSLHKAYMNGYESSKDSKVINYTQDIALKH